MYEELSKTQTPKVITRSKLMYTTRLDYLTVYHLKFDVMNKRSFWYLLALIREYALRTY